MWKIKHNNNRIQMIDMGDCPSIHIADIAPEIREGIKYLNTNDEKIYEYAKEKWIEVE